MPSVSHFNFHAAGRGFLNIKRQPGLVALDFGIVKIAADQALNGKNRVFWINHGLTFCQKPDQTFIGLADRRHRRRRPVPFVVFQNLRLAGFNHRHRRIGCA